MPEETKPVEREGFEKWADSAGFSQEYINLENASIRDAWNAGWDAALERAAQATRCYKCEVEIRALKGRE